MKKKQQTGSSHVRRINVNNYYPFLIRSIANLIARGTHYEEIGGYRIGLREWRVLALTANDNGASGKTIADRSSMDGATVSRALRTLGEYGLIQRSQAADDWRSEAISLSSEGKAIYNQIASQKLRRARRMRKYLSADEYQELLQLLRKLRKGVIEELDGS